MNTVERIKYVLSKRGIPVSKLESDLGFANGYISSLRRGTLPADRLSKIAAYFDVSGDYLLGEKDKYGLDFDDWKKIGFTFKNVGKFVDDFSMRIAKQTQIDEQKIEWFFDGVCPLAISDLNKISDEFGYDLKKILPEEYREMLSNVDDKVIDIQKAFFEGYGEELTQEEKDELWKEAQDFARFKALQLKGKSKK